MQFLNKYINTPNKLFGWFQSKQHESKHLFMAHSLGTFSTFIFFAPVPLVRMFFPSGDSVPSAWSSGEQH
jgi:hypothetical protein